MNFKKILPHLVAIIIFVAGALIYFSPILDGKQLNQSDMSQFAGVNKSLDDYHRATGVHSEWTDNMFSGMPTYQINNAKNFNIVEYINNVFTLGGLSHSAGILFLMALGFYVFLVCMGANPWMSIFAGLVYALGSYNVIIIGVGHITKAWAMAMIAPILGGMVLVFKKKYLKGLALFTLCLAMQLSFNHIQITYYTLIMAIILGLSYLIFAVIDKELKHFGQAFVFLLLGAILAVLPYSSHLMVNQQYIKHTMRGGSELTIHPQGKEAQTNANGLNINYAYNWSYGIDETLTILIPDYKGGGYSDVKRVQDGKITENRINELQSIASNPERSQQVQQAANSYLMSSYFGTQPFTSGPVYFGAIVIFLALMGFILVDNRWRWWLLAATVVSIFLSWGSNFMALNEWLFYHLPMYNKFRTPSMALVITNVTLCMAAFLGLKAFFETENQEKRSIALYIAGGVTMLFCLLCVVCPSLFTDFSAPNDENFAKALGDNAVIALQEDRQSLFTHDALRSFIYIALAFATLLLFVKGKIKNQIITICIIGLCAVVDLWQVDKRYVNNEFNYQTKTEALPSQSQAEAVLYDKILNDKPSHYRVYNMASNTFNEANTSYFFPSVGGYSAAKLQRYQDVIDFYFTNPTYKQLDLNDTNLLMQNQLRQVLLQALNMPDRPKPIIPNIGVLNMLDVKYIIVNQQAFIENPETLGAAWFVDNIQWVNSANEEIKALDNFDPSKVAVVNKEFASQIKDIQADNTAKVEFLNDEYNSPDKRSYKVSTKTPQLLVFSEIYYKDSWHAYLDGKEVPHLRANYLLRAMYVPAGEHKIDFVCKADVVKKGRIINLIGSILLVALLGFAVYKTISDRKNKTIKE